MAGKPAVDLNDPATWPDDIEELTSLQDGLPDEDEIVASADETGEEKTPELDDDEKAGEKAAAEDAEKAKLEADKAAEKAKAEEAEEAEAEKKAADEKAAAEADKDEPKKEDEELPILARDGKNTLPYGVLAGEREKNAKLAQRVADLEAQLEQSKGKPDTGATATAKAEPPADDFVVTEAMQQKVDQLKEDWGEEIAETWLDNQRLKHDAAQARAKLDALESKANQTEQVQRSTQEQQVQEAIDSSPDMALWQSQEDGTMYDRALAVHETLMNTDAEYAAMNWKDRMQELPKRTRSMYGIAEPEPEPKQEDSKPPAKTQEEIAAEAKAAAEKAESKPPHSMSDLPKGDTPIEKTELDKLEGADGAEIQQKLLELSNNPEAYERYINSLM